MPAKAEMQFAITADVATDEAKSHQHLDAGPDSPAKRAKKAGQAPTA
ncbi:MAG: hypothetical protein WDN10_01685 [bacterium]